MCTVPHMDPISLALVTVVGTALGGGLSALAALVTRRVAEPSDAEVAQAQSLANEAWQRTRGVEPSHGAPQSTPRPQGADAEAARILTAYAEDLRSEAARIARRAGADVASGTHVRLAADRLGILRQRSSAVADIGLGVGGILLGGAISYVINLLTGGDENAEAEPWVLLVGAVGLAVFVVAATVKWVKR